MIPFGTLFNVAMVLLGSIIGLFFKKFISSELNKKIFFVIGLFTIVLGFSMALKSADFMLMFLSVIGGAACGESIQLDNTILRCINKLKKRINIKDDKFSDAILTSFLLFCVGSMTIVGSIDEGLGKRPDILYTKSVMDGISSIILASTFGIGVLFSIFPMLIFQGGITILVFYYKDFLSLELINHISSVGGVLIIALGLKLLGYKKINPTNMLPAILLIIIFYGLKVYTIA
ncbi:MAG: hypothetical protein CMP56_01950 [Flavobacteriales bacterium]|nr:hypothetical protein [Flavobacteriales bacterium]